LFPSAAQGIEILLFSLKKKNTARETPGILPHLHSPWKKT
jgi:hypothetical protein